MYSLSKTNLLKKYRRHLIIINLILVLLFVNYAIIKKEKTLSEGRLVLLELAPVDPRSLMQGDYMNLRYKITQLQDFREPQEKPEIEVLPNTGYYIVVLDSNNVAKKVRIQPMLEPLNKNEIPLKYHKNNYRIFLGAESYFFQEGTADKFENSKYGALRVDDKGNSILVGLYNEDFKKL